MKFMGPKTRVKLALAIGMLAGGAEGRSADVGSAIRKTLLHCTVEPQVLQLLFHQVSGAEAPGKKLTLIFNSAIKGWGRHENVYFPLFAIDAAKRSDEEAIILKVLAKLEVPVEAAQAGQPCKALNRQLKTLVPQLAEHLMASVCRWDKNFPSTKITFNSCEGSAGICRYQAACSLDSKSKPVDLTCAALPSGTCPSWQACLTEQANRVGDPPSGYSQFALACRGEQKKKVYCYSSVAPSGDEGAGFMVCPADANGACPTSKSKCGKFQGFQLKTAESETAQLQSASHRSGEGSQ